MENCERVRRGAPIGLHGARTNPGVCAHSGLAPGFARGTPKHLRSRAFSLAFWTGGCTLRNRRPASSLRSVPKRTIPVSVTLSAARRRDGITPGQNDIHPSRRSTPDADTMTSRVFRANEHQASRRRFPATLVPEARCLMARSVGTRPGVRSHEPDSERLRATGH